MRADHVARDGVTISARLDELVKKTAADIKEWREALEKIESSMGERGTTMTANMKVVEGWVKDLEAKVATLS